MAQIVRTLVGVLLLCSMVFGQAPPQVAAQTPPPTPQQAAIDQLLKDADAARLKADFAGMQQLAEDAAAQSRAIDDAVRLGRSLVAQGQSFFYRSQNSRCVAIFREARDVISRLNNPASELSVNNNLATCLRGMGNFEEAIDTFRRAVDLSRVVNNPVFEATVAGNIALSYIRLGEFDLARDWADRAYARAVDSKDPSREAAALQVRGLIENGLGDYDASTATIRRAMARLAELPPAPFLLGLKVELLTNIMTNQFYAGRYEEAVTAATESLDVNHGAGLNYTLGDAFGNLGRGLAAFHLGRLDDAETWLRESQAAWRKMDDTGVADSMLLVDSGLAQVMRARGRTAEAVEMNVGILAGLDRMRVGRNVTGAAASTGLAAVTPIYTEAIDLLSSLGRTAEAYNITERYRARLFLDTLNEQASGIGRSMTPAQRTREDQLVTDSARLQLQLWDPAATASTRAGITAKQHALDDDLDALRREVRRQDPRDAAARFPKILTADDVRRSLDADTAVVSFFTGDDRSFVFALTKEGLSTATLPGTRRLGADVAAYRDLLSSRPAAGTSRIAALTRRADALTTSLFGPIASAINGKKRLILLPDGPLNALPFEALGVVRVTGRAAPRGTWLTEQFALSYAPSASALAALDTRPANGTRLLALGDPLVSAPPTQTRDASVPFTALPFTRIEVQKITGLFGADGHADLGAAATPDALTKNPLDSYRYIHIAAHAFVNTVRPGRSGIVLAPLKGDHDASILQADDVMRLTLSADLVTLSACSTALGRTVSREGVMGLTRSFLIAGARSVVASLWNVNDEATATLMERFYTQLRARKPKDEALSAARLSLIRGTNERLKDPYYWAPFILIGAR